MQKSFRADVKNLPHVIAFVCQTMREAPIKKQHLELLVEELFVNICLYAYEGKGGKVEVHVATKPHATLEFRDWGITFNPTEKKAHHTPKTIESAEVGGLGLHFIQTLAKSIHYKRDGNTNLTILQM